MEHLLDITIVALILIGASCYLFRTFKKAKQNCGGICSGCSGSCQTNIKQFNAKNIPIKNIN